VQEILGRVPDRLHHLRVGVTGAADADAAHEVEETVAIDVPDLGATTLGDDEGIVAWIRGSGDGAVACDERLGLGSGKRHGSLG